MFIYFDHLCILKVNRKEYWKCLIVETFSSPWLFAACQIGNSEQYDIYPALVWIQSDLFKRYQHCSVFLFKSYARHYIHEYYTIYIITQYKNLNIGHKAQLFQENCYYIIHCSNKDMQSVRIPSIIKIHPYYDLKNNH